MGNRAKTQLGYQGFDKSFYQEDSPKDSTDLRLLVYEIGPLISRMSGEGMPAHSLVEKGSNA